MTAAIPAYLADRITDAAPGHRFSLYYAGWNADFSKPSGGATPALKATVCRLPQHSRDLLHAIESRQAALAAGAANVFSHPAIATAPFATGLGNEHPLENGFSFLSPYGLPYLPGSGVKGVIRQAAEELAGGEWGDTQGWDCETIHALFGPGEEDPTRDDAPQQGALRFWDVFPAPEASARNDKPLLAVEIMTPHLGKYYQGDATPNTSLTPNPIAFLAVAANSRFAFHVECNPAFLTPAQQENWRTLIQSAFDHAGKWLGFGAKTAVGYGRMTLDPGIARQRQAAAEKSREETRKAAEQSRRDALPPEQRLLAELDARLATLPKDPRTDQPIRQQTSIHAWNEILTLLNDAAGSLDSLGKPDREQLASKIRQKLTLSFKVEGKAEKAMKEKLAALRGQ